MRQASGEISLQVAAGEILHQVPQVYIKSSNPQVCVTKSSSCQVKVVDRETFSLTIIANFKCCQINGLFVDQETSFLLICEAIRV